MSQEFSIASELVPADAPRGHLVKRNAGRTVSILGPGPSLVEDA